MIQLTPDLVRERTLAQMRKYRCPKCLEVDVAPDRTVILSHPKFEVLVVIGEVPEFTDVKYLDKAIVNALIALTVHLAHEMSAAVWNTRPDWIDRLALTPGGKVLAEKWLHDRAAQIGRELIDSEDAP